MSPNDTQPDSEAGSNWYVRGLRFECRPDCGACCTDHGDCAFVYLEPGESRRIAEWLGLDHGAFLEHHTTLDAGWRVLRMDQPECPFLEGSRCTVYPVRPVQCRTFPFWEENLATVEQWSALREFCPGIDMGPVHGSDTIEQHLRDRSGE